MWVELHTSRNTQSTNNCGSGFFGFCILAQLFVHIGGVVLCFVQTRHYTSFCPKRRWSFKWITYSVCVRLCCCSVCLLPCCEQRFSFDRCMRHVGHWSSMLLVLSLKDTTSSTYVNCTLARVVQSQLFFSFRAAQLLNSRQNKTAWQVCSDVLNKRIGWLHITD